MFSKRLLPVLFVLLALLLLGGLFWRPSLAPAPSAKTSQPSDVVIRLGVRPRTLLDVTPTIIAKRGLKAPGITVQIVPVSTPADGLAKFSAGEVDALVGMPLEALIGFVGEKQANPPFKFYALQADTATPGWAAVVVSKSVSAKTLTELSDQVVASIPTDQGEYLTRRMLIAAGVAPEHLKTTRYSPAAPLAGLLSGEHAAVIGPDPMVATAVEQGHRILERGVLSKYIAQGRPFPVSGSVLSTSFAQSHPDAVVSFLELIDQATSILVSDTPGVQSYFTDAEYGGLSASVAGQLVFPQMRDPDDELIAEADRLLEALLRDGLLKQPVKMEGLILKTR